MAPDELLKRLRPVAMRQRDQARLAGVHPDLAHAVMRVLDAMEMLGTPMMVTEGVRSTERQRQLYAQGRTAPGPVVTMLDGVQAPSKHQVHADGYGHAVDCAFLDDPTTAKIETYDPHQPWELYGAMGEYLGCRWGGRWQSPVDRPHLEWPVQQ